MGAWIETARLDDKNLMFKSHPMWVRGLKPCVSDLYIKRGAVAPYVGAWIETIKPKKGVIMGAVAPYVGAWIETST